MVAKFKRCLAPKCTSPVLSRGLCSACYQNARERVLSGEITWAELERRGLAAPPSNAGRPATTAMAKALGPRKK